MKRVLVTGATNIGKAGVATIVYKWGQCFDPKELVYDYLMQSGLPGREFQERIESKGGRMFTMASEKRGPFTIIKWVTQIIIENRYDTMHINSDSAYLAAAYIYAGKRGGIKRFFVHSHCSQIDDTNKLRRYIKILFHYVFRSYICKNSNKYLACSKEAGLWMFGKRVYTDKYQLIYNGVEVERYLLSESKRTEYREKYSLSNKFVWGNIGRFSYQKNHDFLISLFKEYHNANPNSTLVLIGTGELDKFVRQKVHSLNLDESVLFLGLRDDIPQWLSTFDVLVMPSHFEGLPVTMIEAQMASLPCVVSANISKESQFTRNVEFVNGFEIADWITAVENYRYVKREINKIEKEKSMFNIKNAAFSLQNILLNTNL